ncbi:MAG: PAS domain-containing protein [Actinomycetota bacterium]
MPGARVRVLFVEEREEAVEPMVRELRHAGFRTEHRRVDTGERLRAAVREEAWDVAICDWTPPGIPAPDAIAILEEEGFEGAIVVVSDSADEERVVEAMRAGAHDFVARGHLDRLLPTIRRELPEISVRRALRALAGSEARHRHLVETIPGATYIDVGAEDVSSGYGTVFVGPQMERITGYAPQEFVADPELWPSILHPDDRERTLEADAHHFATGEPLNQEYRVIARDGRVVWLLDEGTIVDEGGRRYSQGILSDITERKQAEERLRGTVGELRRIDRDRRRLLSRLVAAQEEERQRIAAEIHDDPVQQLYAAGLRLAMLQERTTDPGQLESIEALRTVLNGTISRLRHMLFELQPRSLETEGLGRALDEYVDYANQESETAYVLEDRLSKPLSPEMRAVAYRMVLEAVSNVRKHADARHATIAIADHGEGVRCAVVDDGRGFLLEDHLDSHRPGHLGLPAMRERVELAGGRLDVRSAPGQGTTVEFWLPAS